MAPRPFYVKFTPSLSQDVVAYRIYVQQTPDPISVNSANRQVDGPFTPGSDGKIQIDLQPLFPNLDGEYTVGISAVDDAGNESGLLEGVTVVDFIAPDAPTDLEFVRG